MSTFSGAFFPAGFYFRAGSFTIQGSTPPGVNPQSAQAYANYIRRLQAGMSGFTCYASLQMPR